MKELSIEQKAKAYVEAIERAKRLYNDGNSPVAPTIEGIFPELKESEDEKIRKVLLNDFKNNCSEYYCEGVNRDMIIAWLEKQNAKVSAIEGFETEFERQVSSLIASAINKEHEYNQGYVKWTANALLNYAKHELEKQSAPTEDELEALRIAAYEPTKNWSEKLQSLYEKLIHYERGEQKSEEVDNLHNYLYGEQKSAWSEEDEQYITDTLNLLSFGCSIHSISEVQDFLLSLKNRYTWKPSNEQMERLKGTINSLPHQEALYSLYQDLKKLREE